jgi:SSS family solute:Na+ symporter
VAEVNWVALWIFLALFGFVSCLGFAAARWRRGDLDQLHEWGLGGRRFGTIVTWFLVGGDLYTAYTFIAVPALAFGSGAIAFFAVPYTVIIYPLLFLVFRRLWHVCHKHGYITAGDFVRGRFGNRWLALAVTVTGIVATMPYIALQLVGIQVVVGALGVAGTGIYGDLPLIVAFLVLAAFTFSSGLRAPASIAIVKDVLIYLTAFAAIIVIPTQLGGFAKIFGAVPAQKLLLAVPGENTTGAYSAYATLAFGSALALFLYPHSLTAILSASSGHAIRRNAALLPGYSFVLGLLALLGFFAIAAGVRELPEYAAGFARFGSNFAVPALFLHSFPSWFVGIAFAAIGIGALVPAAIMSIAAANLYTRNIHREFVNRRSQNGSHWSSSSARCCSSCSCQRSTRSSCSCSAASGSFRPCPRSCSAPTRAGSMPGRCSSAGRRVFLPARRWRLRANSRRATHSCSAATRSRGTPPFTRCC